MREIVLFGGGGHAFAVVELLRSLKDVQVKAIYDDHPKLDEILGIPVHKFSTSAISPSDEVVIAIGNNEARQAVFNKISGVFPNSIHSSAVVYPSVELGVGCQVLPGAVLDAAVELGDFCIVNNNATLSHNTRVGSYSHIAINAAIAGEVTIGEGVLVGAGSVLLPGVKIGNGVTIGAGSVITKDVPDHSVVYGNPGRIIRSIS